MSKVELFSMLQGSGVIVENVKGYPDTYFVDAGYKNQPLPNWLWDSGWGISTCGYGRAFIWER